MDRRNSPPPLPIKDRNTDALVEDIFVALRDAAWWVGDFPVPPNSRAEIVIKEIQEIHSELMSRNVSLDSQIGELSEATKWQMGVFLKECLEWPDSKPLIRGLDGIRNARRCDLCKKAERPDNKGMPFCSSCLQELPRIFKFNKSDFAKIEIVSSATPDLECGHEERPSLILRYDNDDDFYYYCQKCIEDEGQRRA